MASAIADESSPTHGLTPSPANDLLAPCLYQPRPDRRRSYGIPRKVLPRLLRRQYDQAADCRALAHHRLALEDTDHPSFELR